MKPTQQLSLARLTPLLLLMVRGFAAAEDRGALGGVTKWRRFELVLRGPRSTAEGTPNPFGVSVDAAFASPSGKTWRVPGFYDGDGKGAADGNVWKVRFSAEEVGRWTFVTQSATAALDGVTGGFVVTEPPRDAAGFYRWGRLESVATPENGIRHLKFRDGPYWLKAGCDDPENFLGKLSHYDTLAERQVAIDYLAAKGINSLYVMTHNLDGDNKDVWPWLGRTPTEAKRNAGADARFDIPRLHGWLSLFEYMQTKGVVPYLVLEDDSAWHGYNHARYYREIVARFGHLPALLFNLNEEYNENYRLTEALRLLKLLADTDPYDHPRGIHNVNAPTDDYVDAEWVDFTSIQTHPTSPAGHNQLATDWLARCRRRGKRLLMIGFDEARPEHDRRGWWSAYLAGAVWEAHTLHPYDRPLSAWEPLWTELGGARAFLETLPFWEMTPRSDLVKSGKAFCLAKAGQVYALYLPEGGSVSVELPPPGAYEVAWWDPTNGRDGQFVGRAVVPDGLQTLLPPAAGDWAVRLTRSTR